MIATRIARLEMMQIIGNADGDAELFALAHEIAMDHHEPMAVRGRALRIMDRAMGEPELDIGDHQAVRIAVVDYVNCYQ